MKSLNVGAWISAGVGLAAGLAMLLAAMEHNPQGALIDHTTGKVHAQYALLIFFAWFLAASIAMGIVLTIGWAIANTIALASEVLFSRIARLLPQGKRTSGKAP